MSLYKPSMDSRVGVIVPGGNEENLTASSMVVAVEKEIDSPFWSIHFGKKTPFDDRGTIVLEESMIRDILSQIDSDRVGEEK